MHVILKRTNCDKNHKYHFAWLQSFGIATKASSPPFVLFVAVQHGTDLYLCSSHLRCQCTGTGSTRGTDHNKLIGSNDRVSRHTYHV